MYFEYPNFPKFNNFYETPQFTTNPNPIVYKFLPNNKMTNFLSFSKWKFHP